MVVAQLPPPTPKIEATSEDEADESCPATPTPPPRVKNNAKISEQKGKRANETVQSVMMNIAARHEMVESFLRGRKLLVSQGVARN